MTGGAGRAGTPEFESLADLAAWAKGLGVRLEAEQTRFEKGRVRNSISLVWIERSPRARPGVGRAVMAALCHHADRHRAEIALQAHDEANLPAYYAAFGFKECADRGGDVRRTGPEMARAPRALRDPRRYAVPERPAPSGERALCAVVVHARSGHVWAALLDAALLRADPGEVERRWRERLRDDPGMDRVHALLVDSPCWNAARWRPWVYASLDPRDAQPVNLVERRFADLAEDHTFNLRFRDYEALLRDGDPLWSFERAEIAAGDDPDDPGVAAPGPR